MLTTEGASLLSMHEAADYLDVSWETLRKRRKAWGIRTYNVGGRPKFKRHELDEWLESRREQIPA